MSPSSGQRSAIALSAVLALGVGGVATAGATSDPDPSAESSLPARLAPRSLLLDGAARGALLVAVGERGHILLSRDGGATWTQSQVESRTLLTGVWMHDERAGWAVGHDETVLRTEDGGATWRRVHFAPEQERPLLDVWFADEQHGFAIGAYGAFLETADGGATWTERPISADDFHLNQIAAAPDGTLYIAAEAGHLYRSVDRGASWSELPSPYEGSFFGVLPLRDGALLVLGLRGNLHRSEDRGETWSRIETGTVASLMGGAELADGRVVVAGMAGVVLVSRDGGRTFGLTERADRLAAVAVLEGEAGRPLLLGESGERALDEGSRP